MSRYSVMTDYLVRFLKDEVKKTGLTNVVLGLSGGLDSAVVSVLAKLAFDQNVLAVMLPSQFSSKESIDDAVLLCDKFNIRYEILSIEKMINSYCDDNMSDLRKGNFSARMRMALLYDISVRENALVLGTSNKSELMLGYGTIFGDLASAINPIGDLYKSELFDLASYLGVVDPIITKAPSADLFEGQSDEADLGYTYAEIDEALHLYVDQRATRVEVINAGVKSELIDMLIKRIYQNQFKRRPPVIAKLTDRTINLDFNYARDINL